MSNSGFRRVVNNNELLVLHRRKALKSIFIEVLVHVHFDHSIRLGLVELLQTHRTLSVFRRRNALTHVFHKLFHRRSHARKPDAAQRADPRVSETRIDENETGVYQVDVGVEVEGFLESNRLATMTRLDRW